MSGTGELSVKAALTSPMWEYSHIKVRLNFVPFSTVTGSFRERFAWIVVERHGEETGGEDFVDPPSAGRFEMMDVLAELGLQGWEVGATLPPQDPRPIEPGEHTAMDAVVDVILKRNKLG